MLKSGFNLFKSLALALIAAGLLTAIGSCNPMPNNGIPIYIHVDSPSVAFNAQYGANTFAIPDVWATSGSSNLGAYEMPVNIPVLSSGTVQFALSAGIWDNGIVSTPVQYPFYNPDTFTIYNAQPGHVYHIHPVYTYIPYVKFGLNTVFSAANPFTNVTLLNNPAGTPANLGTKCGGIIIPATSDTITATQTVPAQITATQAYVEFDYKMNNPNVFCDVGIISTLIAGSQVAEYSVTDLYTLLPNPNWTKMYLNCNSVISANQGYDFQVYFTATRTPLTGQPDTMFIDNVKILYINQ